MAYKQELWQEAKKRCRLGDEEIRMAKEMGLNPKSLIKNIPGPKESWKAPVKYWIRDMYEERQIKAAQKPKKAERSILLFPEFQNMELIEGIRKQYDPFVSLISPHITLVFPFVSRYKEKDVKELVKEKSKAFSPFRLSMQGIVKYQENGEQYLFLQVKEGAEEIRRLHDSLYQGMLAAFKKDIPYVPHMTVGKLSSAEELDTAWEQVKDMNVVFQTEIKHITVEKIGEKGESITEAEIPLL